MSPKAFASSADLAEKQQTLEVLAEGVYALTAEGVRPRCWYLAARHPSVSG